MGVSGERVIRVLVYVDYVLDYEVLFVLGRVLGNIRVYRFFKYLDRINFVFIE